MFLRHIIPIDAVRRQDGTTYRTADGPTTLCITNIAPEFVYKVAPTGGGSYRILRIYRLMPGDTLDLTV